MCSAQHAINVIFKKINETLIRRGKGEGGDFVKLKTMKNLDHLRNKWMTPNYPYKWA